MALLETSGLVKRFGGLVAVKDIGFNIEAGEILGLIGPNGSGKSTVMKLIMGILRPDAGGVRLEGVELAGRPTNEVARAGIGLVFQHSRPLHRQTVLENILLGLLPDRLLKFSVDHDLRERAEEIACRVGLKDVLHRYPGTLPFAHLRRMEMAKAIARNPKLVLVDEPFAGLTANEVHQFAELIETFRAEGRGILLVDHNVKSVAALVDRIFAMYLGERIAEGKAEEVMDDPTVRRVYLGSGIDMQERPLTQISNAPELLSVKDLSVSYGKAKALDNVSFKIHEGEFVSIVGLNGAGKTTLFNAISGLVQGKGEIAWRGKPLAMKSAAEIARAGIVQCPETRELFGDMTVLENLQLGGQHIPRKEANERCEWLFSLFPILRTRRAQIASTLSGGEQQMLAIARALMMKPKLLILDEPTLGLAPVILSHLSEALSTLRRTTDITILLGEQNVTFALPHADKIYVLEHARMVWEGPPARFALEAGASLL